MSERPFFTVGIPTYNRAGIVRRAISIVLNQSFGDFELIVADNASDDNTSEVVESFDDPRLRYVRHDRNRGPDKNICFTGTEASGELYVLYQDDDLLHHRFLERCHDSVRDLPDAVMYASPSWVGAPQRGFEALLMPEWAAGTADFALGDRPVVADGPRMAATFLYTAHFHHPGVAIRTSAMRDVGGYCDDDTCAGDVVTQAQVLCRGKLVFDPRIGCLMHSRHGTNVHRSMSRALRLGRARNRLYRVAEWLDREGVDWQRIVAEDLKHYDLRQRLRFLSEFIRYSAPPALQRIGWRSVMEEKDRSTLWLLTKMLSRVGPRKLLRYAGTSLRAADGK
jgi:glycosyltransferase involved in cell wall biosynthesis